MVKLTRTCSGPSRSTISPAPPLAHGTKAVRSTSKEVFSSTAAWTGAARTVNNNPRVPNINIFFITDLLLGWCQSTDFLDRVFAVGQDERAELAGTSFPSQLKTTRRCYHTRAHGASGAAGSRPATSR